jgi:hypothetical protein
MHSRILLCLIALFLSGCHSTYFESPPAGNTVACDKRLVGTWRSGEWVMKGADEDTTEEDANYTIITPECRILDWHSHEPPDDLDGMTFSLIPGPKESYAFTRADSNSRGEESAEADRHSAPWANGYMIFRYVVNGDRLAVYQANHSRIAALIKKRKIDGRMREFRRDGAQAPGADEKRSRRKEDDDMIIQNFVSGSSEEISAVLRLHPDIFHSRPMGILHRREPSLIRSHTQRQLTP